MMKQAVLSMKQVTTADGGRFRAELCHDSNGARRVLVVEGTFLASHLPADIEHAYWDDTHETALDTASRHQNVIQELLKAS